MERDEVVSNSFVPANFVLQIVFKGERDAMENEVIAIGIT